MKKEKLDLLKQFRYFRILEDCGFVIINGDNIELKKGDIIRIYNRELEDLVFNKKGGILHDIGYNPYEEKTCLELVKYPVNKPLNIIEYLSMQPNFQLPRTTEISSWIVSDEYTYLTPKILEKVLNDSKNYVELYGGGHMNVSEYNKQQILKFDGKLNHIGNESKIPMLAMAEKPDDERDNIEMQNSTENSIETVSKMKSGLYSTKGSYLSLEYFLEKGEVIDFSKPEYAFSVLNQNFMKVLGVSEEIISPKKKFRIYKREQKDFLPRTETRYYRMKDDVNVKSLNQLQNSIYYPQVQDIGHDFNRNRVKGRLQVVETEGERISVIKVDYQNPAIYGIVDKELRRISTRLTRREAVSMSLQESSKKQREEEEELAKRASKKGKDYFRIKMIADLAKTYADEQELTEEFMSRAYEYCRENEKLFYDTSKILGYDYHLNFEDFYMMHLIRSERKDNRVIDAEYKKKLQEKRDDLIDILDRISKNGGSEK